MMMMKAHHFQSGSRERGGLEIMIITCFRQCKKCSERAGIQTINKCLLFVQREEKDTSMTISFCLCHSVCVCVCVCVLCNLQSRTSPLRPLLHSCELRWSKKNHHVPNFSLSRRYVVQLVSLFYFSAYQFNKCLSLVNETFEQTMTKAIHHLYPMTRALGWAGIFYFFFYLFVSVQVILLVFFFCCCF